VNQITDPILFTIENIINFLDELNKPTENYKTNPGNATGYVTAKIVPSISQELKSENGIIVEENRIDTAGVTESIIEPLKETNNINNLPLNTEITHIEMPIKNEPGGRKLFIYFIIYTVLFSVIYKKYFGDKLNEEKNH
jgi:hypothetical protein